MVRGAYRALFAALLAVACSPGPDTPVLGAVPGVDGGADSGQIAPLLPDADAADPPDADVADQADAAAEKDAASDAAPDAVDADGLAQVDVNAADAVLDKCLGKTCLAAAPCHLVACNAATGQCDDSLAPDGSTCGETGGCAVHACQAGVCTAVGAKLFEKSYWIGTGTSVANHLAALPDGFALVGWGQFDDPAKHHWLMRTDAAGNKLWLTPLGDPDDGLWVTKLLGVPGGMVVAGSKFDLPWMARFDDAGQMAWQHWYAAPDGSVDGISDIVALPNGLAFVASGLSSNGNWLTRTDAQGKTLWSKHYGIYGSLVALPDGFVLAGCTTKQEHTSILRTDLSGSVLWQKDGAPGCIAELVRSGTDLALLAWRPDKSRDLSLLDETGQVLWQRDVPPGCGYFPAVLTALPDGFAMTQSCNLLPMSGQSGVGIWRVDASGHVVWQGEYFLQDNAPYWVGAAALPDGLAVAYRLNGSTRLLRTDWWGNATCGTSGPCLGKPESACDDGNLCTLDFCGAGDCQHSNLPGAATCSTGDACSANATCEAGVCFASGCGCPGAVTSCDDENACTFDSCDAAKGCVHKAVQGGTSCQASDGCGVCEVGLCKGVGVDLFDVLDVFDQILGNSTGSVQVADLLALADGFVALVGGDKHAGLVRYDDHGKVLWSKSMGAGIGWPRDLTQLPDGYLFLAGGQLLRTNLDGDLLTVTAYDAWLTAVEVLPDGLALAGDSTETGSEDFWLARADGAGKLLWHKTYGGKDKEYGVSLAVLPDGFALAGTVTADTVEGSGWLIRTDQNGNLLWQKTYPGVPVTDLVAVQNTLVLSASKGGEWDGSVLQRLGSDGSELWTQTFTYNAVREILALPQGLLIAGSAPPYFSLGSWLARVDLSGNVLWSRPGPGSPFHSAVAWQKNSLVRLTSEVYMTLRLQRLDAWGNPTCASSGACVQKPASGCDDGNPCSADLCNAWQGCHHEGFPDGSACGAGKVCWSGLCK